MKKITLKEQNVYCVIISIFTIDSKLKSIRTFRSGGTYVRWYTIISLLRLHACYFINMKRFFSIQKLGCPYTEGVDDSWITEMIYKPGEPRIKLLQWLFSKCVKTLLLLLLWVHHLLLLWVHHHLKSKQSTSFHLS